MARVVRVSSHRARSCVRASKAANACGTKAHDDATDLASARTMRGLRSRERNRTQVDGRRDVATRADMHADHTPSSSHESPTACASRMWRDGRGRSSGSWAVRTLRLANLLGALPKLDAELSAESPFVPTYRCGAAPEWMCAEARSSPDSLLAPHKGSTAGGPYDRSFAHQRQCVARCRLAFVRVRRLTRRPNCLIVAPRNECPQRT